MGEKRPPCLLVGCNGVRLHERRGVLPAQFPHRPYYHGEEGAWVKLFINQYIKESLIPRDHLESKSHFDIQGFSDNVTKGTTVFQKMVLSLVTPRLCLSIFPYLFLLQAFQGGGWYSLFA